MAYPVTLLIAEAFYTSGIVSRQFQTVAGDQEETGFLKLNEILTDTTIDKSMVPYFTTSYTFNAIAGQERYFIPNLTEAETLTFFINSIRYQMRPNNRDRYFGEGRADNVESLPFNWHVERCFGGSNLFMYFFPNTNYPMQLTGLFSLQSVSLFQDLQSPVAMCNFGSPIINGVGIINQGELVVNGVDLQGTYPTGITLVNFINTGVVPFVQASLVNNQFVLTNLTGSTITVSTSGTETGANAFTFRNYSLTNGPQSQTFFPMQIDQYYINYLQYRLADKLCNSYNFILPDGAKRELAKYEQMISKRSSPMDLTMNKISTLTGQNSINYAQVNLGHGWTTS